MSASTGTLPLPSIASQQPHQHPTSSTSSNTTTRIRDGVDNSSTNIVNAPPRTILFDQGWHKIYTQGISRLYIMLDSSFTAGVHSFSNNEYVDLYTTIYQMCIQKQPHCYTPELYEKYDTCIAEYLTNKVYPALIQYNAGEPLLRELIRRWNDHQIMKKWMHDFFRYLDRFFIKRYVKKPLSEVAILRFRSIVFDPLKQRITKACIELMDKDRRSEPIDRTLLQQVIQLYLDMGHTNINNNNNNTSQQQLPNGNATNTITSTTVSSAPVVRSLSGSSSLSSSLSSSPNISLRVYMMDFERPMLKATAEFYSRESQSWLITDSCPEYLRKVEERLQQEEKRLQDYLHPSSRSALFNTLYDTLLIQPQQQILEKENTGVKAMLETHSEQDLARVYNLYSNVPASLTSIAAIFHHHMVDVGTALINKVSAETIQTSYISDLMEMHERYFELTKTCFQSNPAFQKALRESFEIIVNRSALNSSTAELLSTYADSVLKKGGIKLTDRQLEQTLENLVRLFAYLTDKDLFSEFYRKQLASRLLMQRSASSDAEKMMIGKLKLRVGSQFTSKLEGMINDIRSAAEHSQQFKQFFIQHTRNQNDPTLGNIDFTVQTLSTGFWPSYPLDDLKLPPILQQCQDTFRVYYDSRTSNRKLRWIHDLGTVTIAAAFPKRKVDLILSTVQATILYCFNDLDQITISELQTMCEMEADQLKQQLKILVNGKYRLLIKSPVESYAGHHTLRVNLAFSQPLRSLRLANVFRATTSSDRTAVNKNVLDDRKHAMEANIVRVMKARKTMTHQQLMSEVSAQLMPFFPPEPKQIKQRIEDLIAREYIERDKEQSNVYRYLA